MIKKCIKCSSDYNFSDYEIKLRDKFDLTGEPETCSNCRHQEKLSFCGYINFTRRKSDKSQIPVITSYTTLNKFPIYSISEWWSEEHQPLDYNISYDFHSDFFQQFYKLSSLVPRMSNSVVTSENSDYANYVGNSKNVYLSSIVYGYCENIYYSYSITDKCYQISDCIRVYKSSYCIDCVQCSEIHYSANLYKCTNTRDCYYSFNLIGCNNCLFSSGLRNQEYYIFNKKYSKSEYEKIKTKYLNGSYNQHKKNLVLFYKIISESPSNSSSQLNCENCYGSGLQSSFNAYNCFHCINCIDSVNCLDVGAVTKMTNCLDSTNCGSSELLYNCLRCGNHNYFLRNCVACRASSHLDYCMDCIQCKDCFACVGLKNSQYCIFNKQFSKIEYDNLRNRLISDLKAKNIWGNFFPKYISQFEYNNSLAMLYFPINQEAALSDNYSWDNSTTNTHNAMSVDSIPDNINEIDENITGNIYCSENDLPFRFVKEELTLHKTLGMPLMRKSPKKRMHTRRELLEESIFYKSNCAKCHTDLVHSYNQKITRKIFCNDCYNNEIY